MSSKRIEPTLMFTPLLCCFIGCSNSIAAANSFDCYGTRPWFFFFLVMGPRMPKLSLWPSLLNNYLSTYWYLSLHSFSSVTVHVIYASPIVRKASVIWCVQVHSVSNFVLNSFPQPMHVLFSFLKGTESMNAKLLKDCKVDKIDMPYLKSVY
jgi:hypothetical protein